MEDIRSILTAGYTVIGGRTYGWWATRQPGTQRHEIFFGINRQRSIDYGAVVYLKPCDHTGNGGVHFCREFDLELKKRGQKALMEKYGWSVNDFIEVFGRSWL